MSPVFWAVARIRPFRPVTTARFTMFPMDARPETSSTRSGGRGTAPPPPFVTVSAPSRTAISRPSPTALRRMENADSPGPVTMVRYRPSSSTAPSGMPSSPAIFPAICRTVPAYTPYSSFRVRYTPRS